MKGNRLLICSPMLWRNVTQGKLKSKIRKHRNFFMLSFTENLQSQKYRQRDCFPLPICVIMIWMMKMDKEKELPQRKHPRLVNYDYGSAGAYFITICTQNRRCVFSRIVGRGLLRRSKRFYGEFASAKISAERLFFSADLCYNDMGDENR